MPLAVPSPVAKAIVDVFWRMSNREIKRRMNICHASDTFARLRQIIRGYFFGAPCDAAFAFKYSAYAFASTAWLMICSWISSPTCGTYLPRPKSERTSHVFYPQHNRL